MIYAAVKDSKVVNIILLDSREDYEVEKGCGLFEIDPEVSIGWTLVSGVFVAPEPEPSIEMPEPEDSDEVLQAKYTALQELMDLGVTEGPARTIVGLPAS